MFYIKVENEKAQGYPISEENLREILPYVSLPIIIRPDDIIEYGFIPFKFSIPPEVDTFDVAVETDPIIENGIMIQQFLVREMGDQEKQAKISNEIQVVRNLQRSLLAESDWTELPSVRLKNTEAWAEAWDEYRTLLRDVDKQEFWPFNIVWPKVPSDFEE
jgi:hypothetical protein